jgi:hypothetical protein
MTAWLDENCGADGWAMTPSGTRGVLNDAASIYFLDTTLAGAFVARWCAGYRVETAGGVFQVRDDDPAPPVGAGLASDAVRQKSGSMHRLCAYVPPSVLSDAVEFAIIR